MGPSCSLRGMRVLIVDDDEDTREILGELLGARGIFVALAKNGAEALAHLETTPVDAVLCDVMLSDVDGTVVVAKARAGGAKARFVGMSGFPVREGDPFDAYLRKPFDAGAIVATLEAVRGDSGSDHSPPGRVRQVVRSAPPR